MNDSILNSVFRAYDIRGKVPAELNEDFFYNLGRAYATKFHPSSVVVGHDIRPESYIFKQALIRGLRESGTDVTDLGEIPTEMLYFVVGEYTSLYDGGLVVTASHNPQGWNGCKLVAKGATPVGKDTGLEDLKSVMGSGTYVEKAHSMGGLSDFYAYPEFKEKILSFITTQKVPASPLQIIVDAGNGIGGRVFDYVFGDLPGINIKQMYFVPDGRFPHHVPDPMKEENVVDLKKRVLVEEADLGIAIDGDADRVFFIDKKGRRPDGVYTGVLLARHLLSLDDNKKIIHDPRITWPFVKETASLNAETFQSVAGHSNFKKKMADEGALFGAEASAHFYYRDFYNCDSAMVTIAIMLDMLFQGLDFPGAVDELFEKYPNSGEVNYKVESVSDLLSSLEDRYVSSGGVAAHVDGLSMEFPDWRFNIRASNTQPLIRLNLEAESKDLVVEKFLEVEGLIGASRENSPALPELL